MTGTAFNCNTDYPGQIQLTLVEGAVEMNERTTGGNVLLATLHPGNHFNYNVREHSFQVEEVDVRKFIGWKDGYLLFDNDLMKDVVERISYWYGVDILLADKELENMRFTATFTDLKLAQIIDILELSSNMAATYKKGSIQEDGSISKEQLILRKRR
ncbi:MAG: DUF4974 domain-containing protein [Tannerellaceae bacterium]|nr:DUF4974 domain-containing protein [Tannerellaceae bacterium]